MAKKGLKLLSKIQSSDFCQKFDFFFRFFHRSSDKSRRKPKRPTALEQLAKYANDPYHFTKIYFLTNFLNFCRG